MPQLTDLDQALLLLAEALDIFHGERELCDDVGSREWLWRWRSLTLLADAQEATHEHPTD